MDQQIDENLRRVYSDVANEPLPNRFTQLLDQLREQERQRSGQSSEEEK
ncbi:NepR family anti-sigma factor [Roseovarius amoyensis]|nr:NepR family anti-sigma factor [Roseovarius amoyensis]